MAGIEGRNIDLRATENDSVLLSRKAGLNSNSAKPPVVPRTPRRALGDLKNQRRPLSVSKTNLKEPVMTVFRNHSLPQSTSIQGNTVVSATAKEDVLADPIEIMPNASDVNEIYQSPIGMDKTVELHSASRELSLSPMPTRPNELNMLMEKAASIRKMNVISETENLFTEPIEWMPSPTDVNRTYDSPVLVPKVEELHPAPRYLSLPPMNTKTNELDVLMKENFALRQTVPYENEEIGEIESFGGYKEDNDVLGLSYYEFDDEDEIDVTLTDHGDSQNLDLMKERCEELFMSYQKKMTLNEW